MGLFSKKSASDVADSNNLRSGATTIVPSQNVSNSNLDKETETVVAEKQSNKTKAERVPVHPASSDGERTSLETNEKQGQGQDQDPAHLPSGEDDIVYPTGAKLAVILAALCLSVFLLALDNTIIATAIPKITDHFNSLGDVGWYGSSYLLTTCALQLFFGK